MGKLACLLVGDVAKKVSVIFGFEFSDHFWVKVNNKKLIFGQMGSDILAKPVITDEDKGFGGRRLECRLARRVGKEKMGDFFRKGDEIAGDNNGENAN